LANRENVRFHASAEAAEAAGFRPCKRCRPEQPPRAERNAALVAEACRLMDEAEEDIRLDRLAGAVGMSPYHFHRVFKQVTGLTPKAYSTARRASRVGQALGKASTITDAIYDSGYQSSAPFYSDSKKRLGMTPTIYRKGGSGTRIQFALGETSLGSILVAASKKGLCAILLGEDPAHLLADLEDRFPQADLQPGDSSFDQWVAEVVGLVEHPEIGLDLPLDIRGTAFQQRVWQALRDIPVGETRSYKEVADMLGLPKAARAVAQACAANRLAVAIPCHRVVRNDGGLSGYRWGVERKQALLDREARK
jgi:AraC family transcriptional regulator of adaptative response/methylated-DNA-[protein]-cysteine methyltransferase